MSEYVIDSSALLAVVYKERGADVVESLFSRSVISAVNLAETIGKMVLKGASADSALDIVLDMVPTVIPLDQNIALLAARLAPESKKLGLSLGDRACLATAIYLQLGAVTADKAWSKLNEPVKITVIR